MSYDKKKEKKKITKKQIIIFVLGVLCVIFAFFLIGCNTKIEHTRIERVDEELQQPISMFIVVEGRGIDSYRIVYHRDTKVMYAVSCGGYNAGNFTVLLNPDGSPMLWKGD